MNGTELEIIRDVTGESKSCGKVENYVELFNDRLEKLEDLVEVDGPLISLNEIYRQKGGDVSLVGLVQDHRETRKGDRIMRIEDSTGEATVWVSKKKELARKIDTTLPDEVVGFDVKIPADLDERGSPLVWGNRLYRPGSEGLSSDSTSISTPDSPLAVLTSDWHVGSKEFLKEPFQRFLRWLNGNEGEKKLADRVEYLLVAGDSVDGNGVYPSQEKELEILDVEEQYELLAEHLSSLDDDITVVMGPGNHDAVRLAEPQPAIPEDVGKPLLDEGVVLVGSPCFFRIGDLRFLMYHGGGMDDLVSAGVADYSDREELLVETLERRHLAPVYRNREGGDQTPTAPEVEDYLAIDKNVDVLHAGHTHGYGVREHNGVSVVLSGTFQGRTSYQKSKGITPDSGRVALVNLQTGGIECTLDFMNGGGA